jgi:hypothetical protein
MAISLLSTKKETVQPKFQTNLLTTIHPFKGEKNG